jgi:pyrroloquinoline-quinone synthase
MKSPVPAEAFVAWLRREGASRYHDLHDFHVRMHGGALSKADLQRWVLNRYYYQTRIPLKDALILAKSEDSEFRRGWLQRIIDHDGRGPGEGGLELWLRLAEGVGLVREDVKSCRLVLPGVRFACDHYVTFVKERTLLEAVASSLTEFFAPDLMQNRILAWEKHYAFVEPSAIEYFRSRVPRARRDAQQALTFVVAEAHSLELQELAVAALIRKTEILWHLLDCVAEGPAAPALVETPNVRASA